MTMSAQALFLKACVPSDGEESDASLLADFFAHRDERAFATLVRRHERTVWGVCKRVLPNTADAEDAFQATFLVLVCRGRTLAERGSIGGWLYRVAHRIAWKGRAMADKRKRRETKVAKSEAAPESEPPSDLMAIIGEELEQLSEPHRLAIIVCDLDGLSRSQAAARLGCNEGTLSARLNRGRKQLAQRLRARGITTPVVGLGALMGIASNAPAYLGQTTVDVASTVVALGIFNRAVSASVAALVSGTTREMTMRITTKVLAALALSTGLIGGGWFGWPNPPAPIANAAPVPLPKSDTKVELPGSAYNLLRERKVLRELKCTAEQRMQIEDALDAAAEARPRIAVDITSIRNNPKDIQPALDLHLAKLTHAAEGEATAVGVKYLTRPQLVRLGQIGLQTGGVMTFLDDRVADELKLSNEQRKGVRRAINVTTAGLKFITPSPIKMEAAFDEVMVSLTKEQSAKWNAMTGDRIGFRLPPVTERDRMNLFTEELLFTPPMTVPFLPLPPAPPKKD